MEIPLMGAEMLVKRYRVLLIKCSYLLTNLNLTYTGSGRQ